MSDAALTLRPVWVRFRCEACDHRLALRLSDQFDRHRADYQLYACSECRTVRSYEEFADAAALLWRRRTIYREIFTALEKAAVSADSGSGSGPSPALARDRIARCVRELEVLDRYGPAGPPTCDECGVLQRRVPPAGPGGHGATNPSVSCPSCGEHPMAYELVYAGPAARESRYRRGVVCPVCDGTWDVRSVLEPGAPSPWLWTCEGCFLVASLDTDVDRAPPGPGCGCSP